MIITNDSLVSKINSDGQKEKRYAYGTHIMGHVTISSKLLPTA